MNPVLKLGLAWQSVTSSNLGVSALGLAQLSIARAAAERAGVSLKVIEFCHTEQWPDEARASGLELGDALSPKRMLLGRTQINEQLRGCDLLLDIGEGDSFADIYGGKRFALLAFLKWRALREGVPLVISPQTIGPFEAGWTRAVARRLMARATRVFARDHMSMAYLQELGLWANAQEVIDVAFRLPFERREAPDDGQVHVGLNVSGLLYNGGYTGGNQFGLSLDYRALIERLGPALQAEPGVVLHLIGHVNSEQMPVEDDYRVCAELAARWPGSRLAPRFRSPIEAKTYISGLHFFAGARMHACIGAFSSGVPVVPMAYSRKFNGLFQSLGYTPLADMKRHSLDEALQAVLDGLRRRDTLRAEVAEGNALAQRKLQGYEDYLVELFRSLGHARH
jgi:colanic acid/amylovoran biosynthesis protein